MIFFTSDPHFGHANIIRHCDRPFSSVEEMNEIMIRNWNERVSNADTVYILGDLMFRIKEPPEEILCRLAGKKHLIVGNHDRSWMKKCDPSAFFESVSPMLFINDGVRRMTLCHYPMMSWPDSTTTYMIFGHIHNNTNADYWPLIEMNPLMMNAGVDINGFKPVTFDEMMENNILFKERATRLRTASDNSSEMCV